MEHLREQEQEREREREREVNVRAKEQEIDRQLVGLQVSSPSDKYSNVFVGSPGHFSTPYNKDVSSAGHAAGAQSNKDGRVPCTPSRARASARASKRVWECGRMGERRDPRGWAG